MECIVLMQQQQNSDGRNRLDQTCDELMMYRKKPVLSSLSKIDKTKLLKWQNGSLMKVESIIAECSKGSILQYFWPALSDNRSWKSIFGLLLSGCLRQVFQLLL